MTRKGVPSPLQLLLECGTKGVLPTQKKEEGEETSFHFPYSSYGDREEKRMSFFHFLSFPGHISWIFFKKKLRRFVLEHIELTREREKNRWRFGGPIQVYYY